MLPVAHVAAPAGTLCGRPATKACTRRDVIVICGSHLKCNIDERTVFVHILDQQQHALVPVQETPVDSRPDDVTIWKHKSSRFKV